jgi:UMP-CMP kinase
MSNESAELSIEAATPTTSDPEQTAKEEAAAVKIQSIARAHEERERLADKQHAAEDIQRLYRGNQARQEVAQRKGKQTAAATTIQARIRQKEARSRVQLLRAEKKAAEEHDQAKAEAKAAEAVEAAATSSEQERQTAAATKIQARIRQREAREKIQQLKQERKEQEKAALKIENTYRQKQAKKELNSRRQTRDKENATRATQKTRQQQQQQANMQDTADDQNWLDEELGQAGVTGHLPKDVDGHFHRGIGAQKHHHAHHQKLSKDEKKGLAFGKKLDEGGRDTYVDAAYGGGDSDHAYNAKHHHHISRDGEEVDYIRHAKQKKIKKHGDVHKYDPEMFEKVFELIEGVVESNRNAKDGFGARTIFGEHTSSIMDVFAALDRDKDGTVTHEEFKRGMHRLGIGLTDKQITVMLKHMDKDNSGEIEYNEFVQMFQEAHVEHKRVQRMLHHHEKDSSTASHLVKTHKTEDERRKKQHQDLVMKRAGMTQKKQRGGGDSKELLKQGNGRGGNNTNPQRGGNQQAQKYASNTSSQRNANGVSNDRANSPGWRDQGKSKLPRYGSPGVDPDLLFDDSDPFFRDALDTLSTVPKQKKPPIRRGGVGSPVNMSNDPSSTTQITAKAPWVAFIIGGPGSSAHKICAEMARMHGYTHLSAEKAIRDEVASGSSCGKEIIHAISQGRVPVDSTIEVIMRNILKSSGTRVLVEGFPQDIEQAQGFEEAIGAVQGVVYVKCSRREMQRRILEAAGKDAGDIDSVSTVRDARRQISEFEDKIAEVLTYYSLGNKIFVIKDGPSLLKMCNQTDGFLGRFPAPSRSFGTQTDSGLVTDDTANNMSSSSNDWSEMREKPSPFFNGENTAVESGFVRGGRTGQSLNVPTPPKRRGGKGGSTGGPRTEKIQQNQQIIMDGPRSELEKWFQSINIMGGPVNQWRTNFANGYLFAQILELFFPSELQSVGFHTGVSSSNKRDNWRQLQTFFLRYDFPLSDNEIMSMMQAKKSAIVPMLLKLHSFLVGQG